MRLPKTWTKIAAGHYRHPETGTEIVNTWAGRKLSSWWVCVPPRLNAYIEPGAEGRVPVQRDCKTLTAAIVWAVNEALPRTRAMIAEAWDTAHLEWAASWAAEGPIDVDTFYARRDAVRAASARTGATAEAGQLVIHIDGAAGIFHGIMHYDRPFHGMTGDVAAVTFADFPGPQPVAPGDVVVLDHVDCKSIQPDHNKHILAVGPRCLVRESEDDLRGPELVQVTDRFWRAADGVALKHWSDDTWEAWHEATDGSIYKMICHKATARTAYRWINLFRDAHPELGTPGPGPSPDGPGPGPGPVRTQTRTPDQPAAAGAADRPAPSLGPVALGYRLEVRTDGGWVEKRTGHTPPIYRPDPRVLDALADTVLGNAGPVLGLGPTEALPPVRVQTWHSASGLTGSAARGA